MHLRKRTREQYRHERACVLQQLGATQRQAKAVKR